ncbi:MAG: sterol desaturase family protein [Flavobacteriales bacterium]|nr:sterol desaturase family protein [Bacteroidota bacterium]MCB9240566.1 sterol desaturase family protein [Flavobacteriales bacterium]
MSLVIANALLLIFVVVEIILLAVSQRNIPWREIVFNLNSGHILMWVIRGLEVGIFHYLNTRWGLDLMASWPYWVTWVVAFVTWDFCFYWLHRLHHKYPWLWAVHVVHHEGEHYGLSLGIRNSWYSSLTSIPFFVALALLGVPVDIFLAVSSIHYMIQFYNHNGIVKKSGWLEKMMITPSHHKVHHGRNPEYIDKNFGGTLIIWDKLFGTFQPELADIPVDVGVNNYQRTDEVIQANNRPMLQLFGVRLKRRIKRERLRVPDWIIACAGLLLFGLLLVYIWYEQAGVGEVTPFLFWVIFMGTIATGGISEGRRWGVGLWCLIFLVSLPLAVINFPGLVVPLKLLALACFAHGCVLMIQSYRTAMASPTV